jgi:zinc transporter 9
MRFNSISGLFPVVTALIGNIAVAVIKFSAAFVSGSSAMFSEAVHSVADTLNQSLLLVGIRRSMKKPDAEFVYGYGYERFFWALISACGIFFIGAGVTMYNGISSLIEPNILEYNPFIFAVLGTSFFIESITFIIAWRELKRRYPDLSLSQRIQRGDPSTLAVFFEDGVALLGICIAFLAIGLSLLTGSHVYDAMGSIVIGILLGGAAMFLILKNRSFLMGRSIPDEVEEDIITMIEEDPAIERVLDFKSTVLNVGIFRIKCEIEFNGNALLREISESVPLKDAYEDVREDYEEFKKFCVDYADRIPRLVGKRIDDIEKRIKTKHPSVRYIDIELN